MIVLSLCPPPKESWLHSRLRGMRVCAPRNPYAETHHNKRNSQCRAGTCPNRPRKRQTVRTNESVGSSCMRTILSARAGTTDCIQACILYCLPLTRCTAEPSCPTSYLRFCVL